MKLTRVIAGGLVLGLLTLSAANAQALRDAAPPAEFPPASFKGKQFVDSRGCVYIRAGISGNVTWVPRVSRDRRQICGFMPTFVAGASLAAPPKPTHAPVIITGGPAPAARATVTRRQPSPGPAPAVFSSSEPAATVSAAPRTPNAAVDLPPDTRVVPRHVYEQRQNTTNVTVPSGYRTVWDDDRLNPHRAERTLRPAQVQGVVSVPSGYRLVGWQDNRLNPKRGARTAEGDAQSNQIWSNTVPRTLRAVPPPG